MQGSQAESYNVRIDITHPRKSECDCPFANGRKICKHMVALAFKALPSIKAEYLKEIEESEREAELREKENRDEIRQYVMDEFGYDLSRTCDEIRPGYYHVETCQETVPEAITAFLEGESFEDVIRTAVSLGGDCDTLTCIAGGIAEAFYGVPDEMRKECRRRLPEEMLEVLDWFDRSR